MELSLYSVFLENPYLDHMFPYLVKTQFKRKKSPRASGLSHVEAGWPRQNPWLVRANWKLASLNTRPLSDRVTTFVTTNWRHEATVCISLPKGDNRLSSPFNTLFCSFDSLIHSQTFNVGSRRHEFIVYIQAFFELYISN